MADKNRLPASRHEENRERLRQLFWKRHGKQLLTADEICLTEGIWKSITEQRLSRLSKALEVVHQWGVEVDHTNYAVAPLEKGFSIQSVESLADLLLQDALHREQLEGSGKTQLVGQGLVLPESVINTLAVEMMQNCTDHDVAPPPSLSALLRVQLDAHVGEDDSGFMRRSIQRLTALHMFYANPDASMSEIAKAVGVNKKTISRWRKQDDFEWRLDTEEGRKIMSWEIEAQHRLEKIRNSNIDGEDQREE